MPQVKAFCEGDYRGTRFYRRSKRRIYVDPFWSYTIKFARRKRRVKELKREREDKFRNT